jgi:Spy/CpxP family protein refolding chaperone
MKKLLAIAAFAALGAGANAADQPPAGGRGFGGDGGFMQNLTEEQKACIEKAACQKTEKLDGDFRGGEPKVWERGEKPQRPEMTDEEKAAIEANRECTQKAFADCGVQMPERPEGGRPPFGEGKPQQ